jgi:DNA topoisomerase-1
VTAGSPGDEQKLYELIRIRALASQMAAAKVMRSKILAEADADIPNFAANGSRVTFPGWLMCDTRARGEDVELPKLADGAKLDLVSLTSTEKQTEPPNRYTEAGLIKELEKRGIGRPSTYASIMKTIQDRGYVEKTGRTLTPTATGMVVSGFLEEHFPEYISDSFTAEMEDELDEIARGERGYEKTLSDFYTPFQKAVGAKDSLPKATSLGAGPEEFPCPLCGSAMEFKLGRGGIFLSCTKYPECTGARQEDGTEVKPDEPIGMHPEIGRLIFIRTGRFGPYVEMPLEDELVEEAAAEVAEEPAATDGKKKKPAKKAAKKPKKKAKPKLNVKRASIPPGTDLSSVTLEDAVRYLSLPREVGTHPETGEPIVANTGRFGPYVAHNGEFRSIKKSDPYTITFDEALALVNEPKRPPKGVDIVREVGKHPKTGKLITLYKSKQGLFLKKGLRRIYFPESQDADSLTPEECAEYLK